jgi:hypothetical protein
MKLAAAACMEEEEDEDGGWWWWWFTIPKEMFISCCCSLILPPLTMDGGRMDRPVDGSLQLHPIKHRLLAAAAGARRHSIHACGGVHVYEYIPGRLQRPIIYGLTLETGGGLAAKQHLYLSTLVNHPMTQSL